MSDPLWHLAVVAMPLDGADGSTVVSDLKGHGFSAYGAAHITADSPFAGGSCATFGGGGDYFRADAVMPDLNFSLQNFRIAFWVKTVSINQVLLDFDDYYDGQVHQIGLNGSGQIVVVRNGVAWFSGQMSVNNNAWRRVVVGKIGVWPNHFAFMTVDGILTYQNAHNESFQLGNGRLAIGAQVRYRDAAKDFVGSLDDLVIHVGGCNLSDSFLLPSTPFDASFGVPWAARISSAAAAPVADPMPPVALVYGAPTRPLIDLENGGDGRIVGTTKNTGNPDYPVSRRVRLLRKRDGQLVREGWSDAAGNYQFDHIRRGVEYVVLGHDHTGVYNAEVADSLLPDQMP